MATEIPATSSFGDINDILGFIRNLTGTQSDSSTTTDLGGTASAGVQSFLSRLFPDLDSGAFSPEAAVTDSQGLVHQIMTQLQEGTLPQIYNQQNASGAYNSTTGQLLANDATSRAAGQGAAAVTSTKEKYAGIRSTQMGQLMQFIMAIIKANGTTNTTAVSGKPAGSPASNLAKAAIGAAATNAAKKAAAPPKPTKPSKPEEGNSTEKDTQDAVEKAITDAYKENGGQQQYDENSGEQLTQDILNSLNGGDAGTGVGANGDPNSSDIPDASNSADAFNGDTLTSEIANNSDPATGAPDSSNMDDMFGDFSQIDLNGFDDNSDPTNSALDPNGDISIDNSDNGNFSIIDEGGDDFG